MPNITSPQFVESHNMQTNDQLMCVYMGSLIRTVIALHNLIDNKVWIFNNEVFKIFYFLHKNFLFDGIFHLLIFALLTLNKKILSVILTKDWKRKGHEERRKIRGKKRSERG